MDPDPCFRPPIQHPTRLGPIDAVRAWQPSPAVATAAIAMTAVGYAFASFFSRRLTDAGLAPTTVALARFALIALLVAPFLRIGPSPLRRRAAAWAFVSGVALALGWVAYVRAVGDGDLALAGVAYLTYPLFAVAALALVFGVAPTGRQVLGATIVVVAAVVALGVGGGNLPLITFAAPASCGFAIAVLTERMGPLDPFERIGMTALGATVVLTPLVVTLPLDQVVATRAIDWASIVGLGLCSALVPMIVYAVAAPVIGAARSTVAGALELPTVFVIGALFFGQPIRGAHLVAAALIVLAIALSPATRSPVVDPDTDGAALARSARTGGRPRDRRPWSLRADLAEDQGRRQPS